MNSQAIIADRPSTAQDAERTYAKVTLRLIPFLFICYVVSYLDRINVGYAQLQIKSELGFSDAVYGLGAGIFFIGYFLFEVPSNLLLARIGAKRTICRIMLLWGLASASMAFVRTPTVFYLIRFLLGVFEAGFFPGIILYLTYWFPGSRRARIIAMFMSGIAVAGVIGGPLSGWIMTDLTGLAGLSGWQWMFILEGLPACFLGIYVLFRFDDRPEDAAWLTQDEKRLIRHHLDLEARDNPALDHGHGNIWAAFRDPKVYVLSFSYFCFICGVYVISFWLPTFIKEMGVTSALHVGLLSVIPYSITAIGMILIGRHSDQTLERRWHCAIPAFLGGIGLIAMIYTPASNMGLGIAFLSLASLGIITTMPLFWAIPTAYLKGDAAAAGIAFVNSLGLVGGFVSPFVLGWIKTSTGSLSIGFWVMAGVMFAGGLVLLAAVPRNFLHEHSEAE